MRELEDGPIVKLVNMVLIDMIKKKAPMVRVRTDGPTEEWIDGAWVEMTNPPAEVRPAMIDRLKEMADMPEDAPLRFEAVIKLILGTSNRKYVMDAAYSRTADGGVVVLTQHELAPDTPPSNEEVMQKAFILLSHASEAPTREEIRARVREAVERVNDQPGRRWLLRTAASTCTDAGIYDDALEWLALAAAANADYKTAVIDIDVQIGMVLAETHRWAEAEAAYRRALANAEALPRPNFYEVYALLRLAELAIDRGDAGAAERDLARLGATVETLFGPKSVARLLPCAARVRVMRERGDAAGAETLAAASMREAEDGGLVGETDDLREQLAEIALARGDSKAAIEHLREVLQLPSRSPMRARIYATLARAQRAIGRDTDAVSSLRAARALVDGALATDHPLRIEIDRDLATLTAAAPYR